MNNAKLIKQLNDLLADSTVYYQKLRSCHWLVQGKQFFRLHEVFQEMYSKWEVYIDEIAERILMIEGVPLNTLKSMMEVSSIEEYRGFESSTEMVGEITKDLQYIVESINEIITEAEKISDRGTANLLDSINDAQQKRIWMLRAWLKEAPVAVS
ncbi:Dps family protein [Candidatus Uabimicrobium amorphum]|uniref:General stress protein 20U n=1 Tax=Uabimicrobium amorphum TaxID=2596890 RepID=A0A5S9IL94_UABAM|nr:DNA starvation/stationary phase protection protein [Candidatus Uabimicrobium amorphum]BBM83784.1 general stress protein 20U [Candidatus Uabimicrobium amorphum]